MPLDFWAYGTPGSVLVAVVPTTEGWRYRDCHFIRWVVDGVPMSWETRHEGRVSALGNEVITLRLQRAEFQRFAAARSVEGRLCGDEFTFDAVQLATWRRMAGRVDLAGR